jgi:hypothetical protein
MYNKIQDKSPSLLDYGLGQFFGNFWKALHNKYTFQQHLRFSCYKNAVIMIATLSPSNASLIIFLLKHLRECKIFVQLWTWNIHSMTL